MIARACGSHQSMFSASACPPTSRQSTQTTNPSVSLIDIFCAFYWIERGFFTLVNSILQVYFTNTPGMKVYVKSYGGWMMSAVAISQAQSLKTSLDNVQATHETEYYYNVGYNSPMKIMNRHNEAWYIVEGEPVCPKME
uniref:Heme-binding protein soul5 n=1 Tax=Cyprinus carpio carpio TaxID=630221 RepID=A0A9J7Y332_CYPCA